MSYTYKPTPGSKTEKLVNAVLKSERPIRSNALAEITGIEKSLVTSSLIAAVKAGLVTACKVTVPGTPPQMEYKAGPGMPRTGETPLKTALAGNPVIPVREAERKTIETPFYLTPPEHPIASSSNAQPAVASNTGSPRDVVSSEKSSASARAVANKTPRAVLPISATTEACDVGGLGTLGFSIDDGGELTIYLNDGMSDPLVLDSDETLALGDFLHCTEALWRP
jgi:hypothetical protein